MRERVGAFRRRGLWSPRRVVAVVAGGVLLVAGCSGDDGSSVAATGGAVVTVDAATTVAPTTTVPTTTTTIATTTTSTSSTTTTSTTIPEPSLDDLEAEIAAAYQDRFDGYWECLRLPADCGFEYLLPGSPSDEGMRRTIAELIARDRFVGDDDVGYFVIESIELSDDRTEATVLTCWWSTAVLYTTPADPTRPVGPDNPPTTVNNTPSSGRQIDHLVLIGDKWLLRSAELLGDDLEEDQCGEQR